MTMADDTAGTKDVQQLQADLQRSREEIARVVVGQDAVVEDALIAILCGGHVLLEGVPGLGKTLMVRTIGQVLGLSFARIQFTPDLMPADITGTNVLMQGEDGGRTFSFERGPVFSQIVLADEINRATPKTQSALLEAMQENHVTVAGKEYTLPKPFFVLATQNPIEMEGTYPLPEAQVDRFFFKLTVDQPSLQELDHIVTRTTGGQVPVAGPQLDADAVLRMQRLVREVPVPDHVKQLALRLTMMTRPGADGTPTEVTRFIRYGSSPRGAQAIILASKARALLAGRFNASVEDVRAVARPALQHRILISFEGEAEGVTARWLLDRILEQLVDVPA